MPKIIHNAGVIRIPIIHMKGMCCKDEQVMESNKSKKMDDFVFGGGNIHDTVYRLGFSTE